MDEKLVVNCDVLNKQYLINDSLKLAGRRGNFKLEKDLQLDWNPVVTLERININSATFNTDKSTSVNELDGDNSDNLQDMESSVEETRDTPTTYYRDKTPLHGCLLFDSKFPPYNSTFIDSAKTSSIKKYQKTSLSPIIAKQRIKEDDLQINENISNHEEDSDGCSKAKCDSDEGWLSDMGEEPAWLSNSTTQLKASLPRTYTPLRKYFESSGILKQPSKRPFRTSSPSTSQLSVKAKRSILEKFDISSILNEDNSEESLELAPRPDTPGTVNSDEIVPCELSSLCGDELVELKDTTEPIKSLHSSTKESNSNYYKEFDGVPIDPILFIPTSYETSPKAMCVKRVKKQRKLRPFIDILNKSF